MVLAAGGAVDFSRYIDARKNLQSALDAAVLAGATADNSTNVAQKTFSSWNTHIDGTVSSPQFAASETSDKSYFSGSSTANLNMYFTTLAGIDPLPFSVTSRAVRTIVPATDDGTCVWLLDAGLTMNSRAELHANLCAVMVLNGTTSLNMLSVTTTPKLCLKSGLSININGGLVLDLNGLLSLNQNCPTSSPPAAPEAPAYSGCDHNGNTSYDYNSHPTVTLSPGVYCGGLNFNGGNNINSMQEVNLEPGLYILKNGSFIFNGHTKVTGSDVTFFYADSGSYLQFNSSNVTSTLSAPASGSCSATGSCGILMYEASGLSTSYLSTFDAGTGHTWSGDVQLSSRIVQENSASNVTLTGRLVLAGMTLNAKTNWTLSPSPYPITTEASYTPARLVN